MNTPLTPREVLLARHASSRPALDAQRAALLARFGDASGSRPRATSVHSLRDILALLHRELFAPCRHAWSALACVWIAILAMQQVDRLSTSGSLAAGANPATQADPTLLALWLEQRRLLAEFSARPTEAPPSAVAPSAHPSSEKTLPVSHPRPLGVVVPPLHSGLSRTAFA